MHGWLVALLNLLGMGGSSVADATPADGDRLRARDGGGRLAAPDRPARRRARDHDGRLRAK